MTILTALSLPLDLSNSYVFLKTSGEISAIFSIDALAKASFDSKEFALATLPLPGASFRIPQLLTVGPKFVLNAQAVADVQLAGHFETKVEIANWDMQQTYPDVNGNYDPKSLSNPQRDFNLDGLKKPTWNASVKAQGQLTAYLKPTLSFGIEFDARWNVGKCTAELVASGYVRVRAEAGTDDANCPFKYGVDAGALLTARATAPDAFKWNPKSFDFFPIDSNLIPGDGSNWICVGGSASKRDEIESPDSHSPIVASNAHVESGSLHRRGATYGPFFHIPGLGKLCPATGPANDTDCNAIKGYDPEQLNDPNFDGTLKKRSALGLALPRPGDGDSILDAEDAAHDLLADETFVSDFSLLDKRTGGSEFYDICLKDAKMQYATPGYPSGSVTYDCADWTDCNNYDFGINGPAPGHNYIDEHILEVSIRSVLNVTFLTRRRPSK